MPHPPAMVGTGPAPAPGTRWAWTQWTGTVPIVPVGAQEHRLPTIAVIVATRPIRARHPAAVPTGAAGALLPATLRTEAPAQGPQVLVVAT